MLRYLGDRFADGDWSGYHNRLVSGILIELVLCCSSRRFSLRYLFCRQRAWNPMLIAAKVRVCMSLSPRRTDLIELSTDITQLSIYPNTICLHSINDILLDNRLI